MKRRDLLLKGAFTVAAASLGRTLLAAETLIPKIDKTNAEWRKLLSAEQYDILRNEGTEYPFSSALLHEKRAGQFLCAACNLPLFDSSTKYDSGTGWPSFYAALPGHVETKDDFKLIERRVEYHCARCGGHHGHVFDDGPQPTGKRFCNNGAVLIFVPKGQALPALRS